MKKLTQLEFAKLVKNKTFLWSIVALAIVCLTSLFMVISTTQMAKSTDTFKRNSIQKNQKIAKKYEGKLDDGKVRLILDDYIISTKNKEDAIFGKNGKPISMPLKDVFSSSISEEMVAKDEKGLNDIFALASINPNLKLSDLKIKSVKDLNINKNIKSVELASFYSWSDFYLISEILFIPIVIIIIIIAAGLFSNERSRNIEQLILSTKYGRNKLTLSKFKAVFRVSTLVFLSVHIISFLIFTFTYGLDGWNGSIQTNFYLRTFEFPEVLNNIQVYLVMLLIQAFGLLFILGVVTLVSSLTNSAFSSMIISLAILMLPKGLEKLFTKGTSLNKVQQYFPINNFNKDNILLGMYDKDMYFSGSFWINISIICVGATVLYFACLFISYKHQENYFVS